MAAEGHPNKIIADVLNISPWTVCTYLRRIFAKLGVTSRAAMVARTLEIGWSRERPCLASEARRSCSAAIPLPKDAPLRVKSGPLAPQLSYREGERGWGPRADTLDLPRVGSTPWPPFSCP